MVEGTEKQVDDDGAEGVQLRMALGPLASSWADELRSVVREMDHAWLEGLRPRLNGLIHHIEKYEAVP